MSYSLKAQPCLRGWTYRVPITIDNSASGVSLTNYQLAFTLNTQELVASGKLNFDGSDIRLVTASGSVLPFWVEKPTFNSLHTKIWVKLAAIPANATETIYLFYGRPAAQDISSGDNTFELFDDFNDVAINSTKWNSCNGGSLTVSDDFLTLSSTTASSGKAILISNKGFTSPVVAEMYVNAVSGSGGSFLGLINPSTQEGYGLFYEASPATSMRMKLFGSDPACLVSSNQDPSPNAVSALTTKGIWQFAWAGTAYQQIDWPGASTHPLTRSDATVALPSATAVTIGNMELAGSIQLDWVRVRKWAAIEPKPSLGEEVASVTSATASNNGPLCQGQVLQLTATAVTGAQYFWTGPAGFSSTLQNPTLTNTTAAMSGTYQVEVSIPSGCSSIKTSTDVMISTSTVPGTASENAVVCSGDNTGVIKLSGYVGTIKRWESSNSGAEPWGTINKTSDELPYTNLVTTTYFRAVVQSGACEEKTSNMVFIEVSPATKSGRAIGSATTCSEDNGGMILLSGHTGQVQQWQASIDNWVSYTDIAHTGETIEYAQLTTTTQYRAVVQSGVCAAAYSEPATITVSALPDVRFQADAVCDGSPMTFKNNTSIRSGTVVSYLWDFGDGTSSIEKEPVKEYLNKGAYQVKLIATSDKGCKAQLIETVTVNEFPVASFNVQDVCLGNPVLVKNLSSYTGGGLKYLWDFGYGVTSDRSAPTHTFTQAGVFPIKLVVETSLGCKDSITRYVEVFPSPIADAGKDENVSKGYSIGLLATGGVTYSWQPITGLSNSNVANPLATPQETTTYTVTVTDARGCSSTDQVTVHVIDDFRLQVSNVLTPDGNGVNDTWTIKNIETFGECNVYVYDRWGKEVYSQKGYKNDWAGYSGTDLLPDGAYYYLITFDSSKKQYKGAITILRNQK